MPASITHQRVKQHVPARFWVMTRLMLALPARMLSLHHCVLNAWNCQNKHWNPSVDEQLSCVGLPNSIMHLIGTLAHSAHLAQQEVASSAGPMPLSSQIHEEAHGALCKSPAHVPLPAPWQTARPHDRSCNSKSSSSGSQCSQMDTILLPELGLLRADRMFDEPKCTEDLDASQQIPHSLVRNR